MLHGSSGIQGVIPTVPPPPQVGARPGKAENNKVQAITHTESSQVLPLSRSKIGSSSQQFEAPSIDVKSVKGAAGLQAPQSFPLVEDARKAVDATSKELHRSYENLYQTTLSDTRVAIPEGNIKHFLDTEIAEYSKRVRTTKNDAEKTALENHSETLTRAKDAQEIHVIAEQRFRIEAKFNQRIERLSTNLSDAIKPPTNIEEADLNKALNRVHRLIDSAKGKHRIDFSEVQRIIGALQNDPRVSTALKKCLTEIKDFCSLQERREDWLDVTEKDISFLGLYESDQLSKTGPLPLSKVYAQSFAQRFTEIPRHAAEYVEKMKESVKLQLPREHGEQLEEEQSQLPLTMRIDDLLNAYAHLLSEEEKVQLKQHKSELDHLATEIKVRTALNEADFDKALSVLNPDSFHVDHFQKNMGSLSALVEYLVSGINNRDQQRELGRQLGRAILGCFIANKREEAAHLLAKWKNELVEGKNDLVLKEVKQVNEANAFAILKFSLSKMEEFSAYKKVVGEYATKIGLKTPSDDQLVDNMARWTVELSLLSGPLHQPQMDPTQYLLTFGIETIRSRMMNTIQHAETLKNLKETRKKNYETLLDRQAQIKSAQKQLSAAYDELQKSDAKFMKALNVLNDEQIKEYEDKQGTDTSIQTLMDWVQKKIAAVKDDLSSIENDLRKATAEYKSYPDEDSKCQAALKKVAAMAKQSHPEFYLDSFVYSKSLLAKLEKENKGKIVDAEEDKEKEILKTLKTEAKMIEKAEQTIRFDKDNPIEALTGQILMNTIVSVKPNKMHRALGFRDPAKVIQEQGF